MSAVFNIANITGSSLAEWRPDGGHNAPAPKHLPAPRPRTGKPLTITTNEENSTMSIRKEIRDVLAAGPKTYAEIKAALDGANVATSLSQMTIEDQLKRTGSGTGAIYQLARAPGAPRKSKKGAAAKSAKKSPKTHRAKSAFSPSARASAMAPDDSYAGIIANLRARRELLERAISSLEQLAA